MGSFQNSFGGYSQFDNNVDTKFTKSILGSEGAKYQNFEVETEEILDNGKGPVEGYLYKVPDDEPEEVDLGPQEMSPGYNPNEETPQHSEGFSGDGEDYDFVDHYDGVDDVWEDGMLPPSRPSEEEEDDDVIVFQGGGLEDFEDLKGAPEPVIPIPGVVVVDLQYQGRYAYMADENGFSYLMQYVVGEWFLRCIYNQNGEVIAYNEPLESLLILFEQNGITLEGFDFSKDNNFFYFYTDHGDFLFDAYLSVGRYVSNGVGNLEYDQIYSILGAITNQFGGYQSFLDIYSEQYLQDEVIREIISHYFPNENVSDEQLQLLYSRIARIGCGYVSCVNTIFDYYAYLTDEEWRNIFGFDRKNENGEYNYSYLIVDFFLNYQRQINNYFWLEDLLGNEQEFTDSTDFAIGGRLEIEGADGMDTDYLIETFTNYINSLGLEVNVTAVDCKGDYQSAVREALENGQQVMAAIGFIDVYFAEDLDNDGELNDYYLPNVGGHGYNIVGITENGEWIVSTWGKQLLVNPNEFDEDTYIEIFVMDYEGGM